METKTLVTTLAAILAAKTGWAWQPTGPDYTESQVGIFYGSIEPSPDRAIGITAYSATDRIDDGLAIRRVQLRFRGAPGSKTDADEMEDVAFNVLHGLLRVAGLSSITRESNAPLPADESGRLARTASYQIIIEI